MRKIRKNHGLLRPVRLVVALVIVAFLASVITPPSGYAQVASLPVPGTIVGVSPAYAPVLIQGMTVHPENPLQFDFIMDTGDSGLNGVELSQEANKLIKYFLASLTLPEKDMWVNLSPYEQDRITSESFGRTEMGRDVLAQDYLLKQLSASLVYPEKELGKQFWAKIRQAVSDRYRADIPVSTLNKVWIVPDTAVVFESRVSNSAFVVESRLKVMMEEDYLALKVNTKGVRRETNDETSLVPANEESGHLSSLIMRELILPEIEREVNEGEHFAPLRQIYQALILATWYKKRLKGSILEKAYLDQGKIKGVDVADPEIKQKIYEQYLEAYREGVYNYIKEDLDPVSRQRIPRKYFSGGVTLLDMGDVAMVTDDLDAPGVDGGLAGMRIRAQEGHVVVVRGAGAPVEMTMKLAISEQGTVSTEQETTMGTSAGDEAMAGTNLGDLAMAAKVLARKISDQPTSSRTDRNFTISGVVREEQVSDGVVPVDIYLREGKKRSKAAVSSLLVDGRQIMVVEDVSFNGLRAVLFDVPGRSEDLSTIGLQEAILKILLRSGYVDQVRFLVNGPRVITDLKQKYALLENGVVIRQSDEGKTPVPLAGVLKGVVQPGGVLRAAGFDQWQIMVDRRTGLEAVKYLLKLPAGGFPRSISVFASRRGVEVRGGGQPRPDDAAMVTSVDDVLAIARRALDIEVVAGRPVLFVIEDEEFLRAEIAKELSDVVVDEHVLDELRKLAQKMLEVTARDLGILVEIAFASEMPSNALIPSAFIFDNKPFEYPLLYEFFKKAANLTAKKVYIKSGSQDSEEVDVQMAIVHAAAVAAGYRGAIDFTYPLKKEPGSVDDLTKLILSSLGREGAGGTIPGLRANSGAFDRIGPGRFGLLIPVESLGRFGLGLDDLLGGTVYFSGRPGSSRLDRISAGTTATLVENVEDTGGWAIDMVNGELESVWVQDRPFFHAALEYLTFELAFNPDAQIGRFAEALVRAGASSEGVAYSSERINELIDAVHKSKLLFRSGETLEDYFARYASRDISSDTAMAGTGDGQAENSRVPAQLLRDIEAGLFAGIAGDWIHARPGVLGYEYFLGRGGVGELKSLADGDAFVIDNNFRQALTPGTALRYAGPNSLLHRIRYQGGNIVYIFLRSTKDSKRFKEGTSVLCAVSGRRVKGIVQQDTWWEGVVKYKIRLDDGTFVLVNADQVILITQDRTVSDKSDRHIHSDRGVEVSIVPLSFRPVQFDENTRTLNEMISETQRAKQKDLVVNKYRRKFNLARVKAQLLVNEEGEGILVLGEPGIETPILTVELLEKFEHYRFIADNQTLLTVREDSIYAGPLSLGNKFDRIISYRSPREPEYSLFRKRVTVKIQQFLTSFVRVRHVVYLSRDNIRGIDIEKASTDSTGLTRLIHEAWLGFKELDQELGVDLPLRIPSEDVILWNMRLPVDPDGQFSRSAEILHDAILAASDEPADDDAMTGEVEVTDDDGRPSSGQGRVEKGSSAWNAKDNSEKTAADQNRDQLLVDIERGRFAQDARDWIMEYPEMDFYRFHKKSKVWDVIAKAERWTPVFDNLDGALLDWDVIAEKLLTTNSALHEIKYKDGSVQYVFVRAFDESAGPQLVDEAMASREDREIHRIALTVERAFKLHLRESLHRKNIADSVRIVHSGSTSRGTNIFVIGESHFDIYISDPRELAEYENIWLENRGFESIQKVFTKEGWHITRDEGRENLFGQRTRPMGYFRLYFTIEYSERKIPLTVVLLPDNIPAYNDMFDRQMQQITALGGQVSDILMDIRGMKQKILAESIYARGFPAILIEQLIIQSGETEDFGRTVIRPGSFRAAIDWILRAGVGADGEIINWEKAKENFHVYHPVTGKEFSLLPPVWSSIVGLAMKISRQTTDEAMAGEGDTREPLVAILKETSPEKDIVYYQKVLKRRIRRGNDWLRISATPQEASEFHKSWNSEASGHYWAEFHGERVVFPIAVWNKMADWFKRSFQFERTGYFLVNPGQDELQIIDFIPTGSFVGDPKRAENQSKDQNETQAHTDISTFVQNVVVAAALGLDLEIDKELQFQHQTKSHPNLISIRAHSHHFRSAYPKGPSQADQIMSEGLGFVYSVKTGKGYLFDARSTVLVDDSAMAGEEDLSVTGHPSATPRASKSQVTDFREGQRAGGKDIGDGAMAARVTYPSFRKIRQETVVGRWGSDTLRSPNPLTPTSQQDILDLLGLRKGEHIFGFAGYKADWLVALAEQGAVVTYSDFAPNLVSEVRNKYGKLFKDVVRVNAIDYPQSPGQYDWSFSFEPMPLYGKGMPLVVLRALLNKKGLKTAKIIWDDIAPEQAFGLDVITEVAEIYGIPSENIRFYDKRYRMISGKESRLAIATLWTTPEARRKAEIDLTAMEVLDNDTSPAFTNLNLSAEEISQSIERIERVATLFPEQQRDSKSAVFLGARSFAGERVLADRAMAGKADYGGVDLEKVDVQIQTGQEGGVRTAFDDPAQLEMLMATEGLGPVIYSIQPMTVPMLNMLMGSAPTDDNNRRSAEDPVVPGQTAFLSREPESMAVP